MDIGYESKLKKRGYIQADFVRGITSREGEKFDTKTVSGERGHDYSREILAKESEILLIKGNQNSLRGMKDGIHGSISDLTKPRITIFIEEIEVDKEVSMHVVSDGRKCFIKYL